MVTTPDNRDDDVARAAADRRQRALGVESGAARAAVLGINDGLVTNTTLILGVVGAASAESVVQLAGLELGSPWAAALSSFVAFAAGALVPLLPWFFASRSIALTASLVLSGVTALGIGGALGYMSTRRVARSALRQLFIVAVASAVTFFVGRLFGVLAS